MSPSATKDITDFPIMLSVGHVAEILCRHPVQVRMQLASGTIPYGRKVGGEWRVRRDLLWAWLAGDGRKAG